MLSAAMPRIRVELESAEHAILESNSVIRFLRPNLYLTVLDGGRADFKDSARLYLDRADALVVTGAGSELRWEGVSGRLLEGKPRFVVAAPDYVSEELVEFVRARCRAHG
jgi:hypothetical protein